MTRTRSRQSEQQKNIDDEGVTSVEEEIAEDQQTPEVDQRRSSTRQKSMTVKKRESTEDGLLFSKNPPKADARNLAKDMAQTNVASAKLKRRKTPQQSSAAISLGSRTQSFYEHWVARRTRKKTKGDKSVAPAMEDAQEAEGSLVMKKTPVPRQIKQKPQEPLKPQKPQPEQEEEEESEQEELVDLSSDEEEEMDPWHGAQFLKGFFEKFRVSDPQHQLIVDWRHHLLSMEVELETLRTSAPPFDNGVMRTRIASLFAPSRLYDEYVTPSANYLAYMFEN